MNNFTGASPLAPSRAQSMTERGHWLAGRVAVVTGASRGIGAATAEAVAEVGAHVVLAARDSAALNDVAQHIIASGGKALSVPTDVSKGEEVQRLFAAAEQMGGPTALVCAAGVLTNVPFGKTTSQIWEQTLGVNLTGTFLCCREAFNAMRIAGGGRIINIASLSGIYAIEKFPGLAAYTASKHGVVGLTEAIGVEGKEHNITAVCLSPGAVDTEMLRRAAPGLRPGLTPRGVATLIVALLDDPLTIASGANIPLFSNT